LPNSDKLSDVLLLIIAIVGTTVAPWQLFFQQSYVIDKRITPRFMAYEKADLWIGIVMVIVGAVAMMAFCAATFAGQAEAGNFTDAGGVAAGLAKYVGQVPATLFAIALIDASIIGAAAVSLASAYALGDVLSLKHSLHRGAKDASGFYLVYCGLIAAAAGLVLVPGAPLGLITEAVQTLAGVLDQPVHRIGDRDPGHAVDHPDGLGALPDDHGRADLMGRRRRDRSGLDRRVRHLRDPHADGRAAARPCAASDLAHAAAIAIVDGDADGSNECLDGRAAGGTCCWLSASWWFAWCN